MSEDLLSQFIFLECNSSGYLQNLAMSGNLAEKKLMSHKTPLTFIFKLVNNRV